MEERRHTDEKIDLIYDVLIGDENGITKEGNLCLMERMKAIEEIVTAGKGFWQFMGLAGKGIIGVGAFTAALVYLYHLAQGK